MGWLCDQVVKIGGFAIADFICPTPAARAAFLGGGGAFVIWVDRIAAGAVRGHQPAVRSAERYDLRVTPKAPPSTGRSRSMREAAPGVRPEEADGAVHRPLPAVPRRAQGPDRRRH